MRMNRNDIGKLSVGLCAATIASTFLFAKPVSADTVNASQEMAPIVKQESASASADKDQAQQANASQDQDDQKNTSASKNNEESNDDQADKDADSQELDLRSKKSVPAVGLIESKDANKSQQSTLPKDGWTTSSNQVINNKSSEKVKSEDWFGVTVKSPELKNVKKGQTYDIQIGHVKYNKDNTRDINDPNSLTYDKTNVNTPDFDIKNLNDGHFQLTAKENYDKSSFSITASVKLNHPLAEDNPNFKIPVTIKSDNQSVDLDANVDMLKAAKPNPDELRPLVKYSNFGIGDDNTTVGYGIYLNYGPRDLPNFNLHAIFNNDQVIDLKSIMVYAVDDPSEIEDANGYIIDATNHKYQHYNYDLSILMQTQSSKDKLVLNTNDPKNNVNGFNLYNKDYSKQPLYIYFKTYVPESKNSEKHTTLRQKTPYGSDLELEITGNGGKKESYKKHTEVQYQSGNGANSNHDKNKPGTPTNPTTPTKPGKPTTPTKPGKPTTPTKPGKPTTPTKPGKPTTPKNPTKPTTPQNPTKPAAPTAPTQPQPTVPEPAQPTTPEKKHTTETVKTNSKHKKAVKRTNLTAPVNHASENYTPKSSHVTTPVLPTSNNTVMTPVKPQTVSGVNADKQNQATLPQTGEKTNVLSAIGMALAAVGGLLFIDRKRKRN